MSSRRESPVLISSRKQRRRFGWPSLFLVLMAGIAGGYITSEHDLIDTEQIQTTLAKIGLPARSDTPESPAKSCRIKGNISGNGRIYHMPGQKYYGATKINAAKGERWFCSEAEARAAGWRKARV